MEFYDLLRKRYSARKYLPKKVESAKLVQILEAAELPQQPRIYNR